MKDDGVRRARRAAVDDAMAAGDTREALSALRALWRDDKSLASAAFILSKTQHLTASRSGRIRVAFLRSFTVEPAVRMLEATTVLDGLTVDSYVGGFNAYAQESLDAGSGLYIFHPDAVILSVLTRDIAPELWDRFTTLSAPEVENATKRISSELISLLEALRSRSQCHIIVHTLELPPVTAYGVLDSRLPIGQGSAIREINKRLRDFCHSQTGMYPLEYDDLVSNAGRGRWYDEKNWNGARLPMSASNVGRLSDEWARFIYPLAGKICKALVVDLDGTLWGGILGEDGAEGLRMFADLQHALQSLSKRGILLAICSKNDEREALDLIAGHREMMLKRSDFACVRINWSDKVTNIREIAAELNLGLDAIAFLDDNPAEQELVRKQLPDVTVLDLPVDPSRRAEALLTQPVLERLVISDEDSQRSRFYAEQTLRETARANAPSLEDYYRSLEMSAFIEPVGTANLVRAAQLTQKTNQFNVTTRRYSEQQVLAMAKDPAYATYALSLTDKFGSSGIVGLCMVRYGESCEIDTFLLSCRVIQRTVETALLAAVARDARERGYRNIIGHFIPTAKNAPARDFFATHGFTKTSERDGVTEWELDPADAPNSPEWIRVTRTAERATL